MFYLRIMNTKKESTTPDLMIFKIGALHHRILRDCNRLFREKEFILEMDQVPVVLSLYYSGAASQQEICAKLQRNKASVNRTISFLYDKKLLSITQDIVDKRKTVIELTSTGKKVAAQAHAILEKYNVALSGVFTKEEHKQFHQLLLKLTNPAISI